MKSFVNVKVHFIDLFVPEFQCCGYLGRRTRSDYFDFCSTYCDIFKMSKERIMEINYGYVFVAIILILNMLVSVFIGRRHDLERFQKFAQIIIVWLIPVVAAIGLWAFYKSQDDEVKPDSNNFGGGAQDSGVS